MALTKQAGAWTYDDLFSLPEDGKRYEIIAGEISEMPPPSWDHAKTVINLIAVLLPIVAALDGELVTAPVGVFFAGADPVEPDIVVLLPDSRAVPSPRGVEGPPDLLIEVLSPSNRGHDRQTKRALYANAGVSEYWLVDPASRTVEILTLDRDAYHNVQTATVGETVISQVLGGAEFPLATVFARVAGSEG